LFSPGQLFVYLKIKKVIDQEYPEQLVRMVHPLDMYHQHSKSRLPFHMSHLEQAEL